jgi:Na+-transporting NADH:ubiquinone oxidoreductase subunit NqrC
LNHTTTIAIIRIIIAIALAASMVVAGVSLASLLKQHQVHAAAQTKQQEQNTVQGLRGNFAKRSASQHANQENQCLRTGKCGNVDLEEQTLGNDNSVTGFADQSKNVQQRIVEPTPSPEVTPTPTVTPTPLVTPTPTP